MNRLLVTDNVNPWHNLALEEQLFETQDAGVTLYLWQNSNTVVIGRNQNAWKECRVQLLESEGGCLARRSSGGGAVFHDLGNLNFTFVLPRMEYDLARQFSVLQKAVGAFGVQTERSGRNDVLLADSGEKFSGNAFRFTDKTSLHHGTILIRADMERLGRYLAPSPRKLAAKGIDSVRSRVCNLSDVCEEITVDSMRQAMINAFTEVYGDAARIDEDTLGHSAIDALTERYASWDWRFGKTPRFTVSFENRFEWGEIELLLSCKGGVVESLAVYSDAMDASLSEKITEALQNAPYTPEALRTRILQTRAVPPAILSELADWLFDQSA